MEHGLIDEYRLRTFPVVLGSGRRLFGRGTVPATLSLVRSSTTSTGAVVSVYRPLETSARAPSRSIEPGPVQTAKAAPAARRDTGTPP
jgi:hypothetical protein